MYTIIYSKTFDVRDGVRRLQVVVVANQRPSTLPTTGTELGLQEDETFAPFSLIIVPSTNSIYLSDENGFSEWGAE